MGQDTGRDVPRLQAALARLRAVRPAAPVDAALLAQECLDILAVLDGMKPVCVLGRGFDDMVWVRGVAAIARALGCDLAEGPLWDAAPEDDALPSWYAAQVREALSGITALYLWRDPEWADAVRAVARAGGRLTVAWEARLLDYPECCVAAHYARRAAFHRATVAILTRRAGGDVAAMRRLLDRGAPLAPGNAAERAALDEALAVEPCPYASFDMCAPCCADPDGPAARAALRYAGLAAEVDPALARALAGAHGGARR